jgi:2,4-dienoyl-CoA reductase-like NADH-dependent reductase (Old Yellow Enzyme family)
MRPIEQKAHAKPMVSCQTRCTIHAHAKADGMTTSRLFSPITLRGLTLDNRIVLSPMCQYASQDGHPSQWHTVHLGTYALANLGLAITEATAVEPAGRISPMCLGLYSDAHQEALGSYHWFLS